MVEHSPDLREVRGSNPGTTDQCFFCYNITPSVHRQLDIDEHLSMLGRRLKMNFLDYKKN